MLYVVELCIGTLVLDSSCNYETHFVPLGKFVNINKQTHAAAACMVF